MFELTHYGDQNERDWMNSRETGLGRCGASGRVEIISYSPFVVSGHRTYFTLMGTEAELILNELTAYVVKGEPWLSTCSNEEA